MNMKCKTNHGYVKLEDRNYIDKIINWRNLEISKMNKTNVSIIDNLEINNDLLRLRLKAKELYSTDKCYVCGIKVNWENDELTLISGRMFNKGSENTLDEVNWFTTCYECNLKLNVEETKYIILDILKGD